jgi:2,4-diaminopentanoate dehydrogenase
VTTRVIQWATGAVGSAQLREVIDDPELELVGVFVFSSSKADVDAGTIVGRPPTGVLATNDKAEIMALDADVVLHAASKGFAVNTNTDDIVALLESGKSVITTTSYNHLPTYGNGADVRIPAACQKTGTRFHAAGENPGFMFERLATGLTALSQRVDKITVQEFVDTSGVAAPEMLIELMGMGKPPGEISDESKMFRAISVQYEQALATTADLLTLSIDEIRTDVETATVDHDVEVACGTLAAGTVVGQIMSWTALHDGRPVLVAEEYWTCTHDIPQWDLSLEGMALRVTIEGAPRIRVDLVIDNDPVAKLETASGGQLAVAMTAVRAIPYVLRAPPGVVVPEVFGAYRWR